VRTHQYKLKDVHSRGVRENTRSNEKIAALNDRVKREAAAYWAARKALVALGRALGKGEWELKEDDVRGLSVAKFSDANWKKKKKEETRREAKKAKLSAECPPSWIWIDDGVSGNPGDTQAMNEGA
jgi:hypothetical protein